MKKLIIFFTPLLIFIFSACSQNKKISNNINDWFEAGSRPDLYEIGTDDKILMTGPACG